MSIYFFFLFSLQQLFKKQNKIVKKLTAKNTSKFTHLLQDEIGLSTITRSNTTNQIRKF